jgi:hypothetical protein
MNMIIFLGITKKTEKNGKKLQEKGWGETRREKTKSLRP